MSTYQEGVDSLVVLVGNHKCSREAKKFQEANKGKTGTALEGVNDCLKHLWSKFPKVEIGDAASLRKKYGSEGKSESPKEVTTTMGDPRKRESAESSKTVGRDL